MKTGGNVTLTEFEALQTRPKALEASSALGSGYLRRGLAKEALGDRVGACKDFRESCQWGDLDCKSFSKLCNNESAEPQTMPNTTRSLTRLKLGAYTIRATLFDYSSGVMTRESLTIKLMIESVDGNGEVKARLFHGIQDGHLNGRINEEGLLELKGLTTWSTKVVASTFALETRIKLKATVKDGKLVEGEYLMVETTNPSEKKVVFDSITWEDNF